MREREALTRNWQGPPVSWQDRAVRRVCIPAIAIALPWAALGCRSSAARPSAEEAGAAATFAAAAAESVVDAPDAPQLGAIAMQVWVHDKPAKGSRRLGYLRVGARVVRDPAPSGDGGCAGGWFKIRPAGFVCKGDDVTFDPSHAVLRAAAVRPDVTRPMPYRYGFVRTTTPLYLRVPTAAEQHAGELGLQANLDWFRSAEGAAAQKGALGANDVAPPPGAKKATEMTEGELFGGQSNDDPLPFWLTGGQRGIPNVSGFDAAKDAVSANRVRRHAGIAFIGSFVAGKDALERRFAVTTDLRLIPTSKVKPESASAFHGMEIREGTKLPFTITRKEGMYAYRVGKGPPQRAEPVPRLTVVRLTGKTARREGTTYRETEGGNWFKASELSIVGPPKELPQVAARGEKWIDVSIENQTLVMYEGTRPVFVTLVSTGAAGLESSLRSNATVRGTFRVLKKHVTATMDSNESPSTSSDSSHVERDVSNDKRDKDDGQKHGGGGGQFELRDVPWVQYFDRGYALHAAYWHDQFGTPRSHGCVNLSPIDAHRLFQWTEPRVPGGWHGVNAADDGTTVHVRR